MRIVLIESGGFVAVPLRYDIDVTALDAATLSALERAMASASGSPQPPPTSAGGVAIRLERDDGSAGELTVSYAAAAPEIAELLQRLRACARLARRR